MRKGVSMGVASLCAAWLGCADPKGRFDEFENRVIDASVSLPDAPLLPELPDITGEFLLSLAPSPYPGDLYLHHVTVVMTRTPDAGTATATQVVVPLTVEERTPVGDPLTVTPDPIPISDTGEFDSGTSGVIPEPANPIGGFPVTIELQSHGYILSEDLWCGITNGDVVDPLSVNLDGSTFAAIRIPDGSTAADLEPVAACPEDAVDGGAG